MKKWPFRFILISRLVEMKGYLSFVRQISATSAPKKYIENARYLRAIFYSYYIYILQRAKKLLVVISPVFRDNKVILAYAPQVGKGDLVYVSN